MLKRGDGSRPEARAAGQGDRPLDRNLAADAERKLDRVLIGDVKDLIGDPARFDWLIAADVLEHIWDPWKTLQAAASLGRKGGTVIVSVPNIRHHRALRRVITEETRLREDQGVFDRTHLRWFTVSDALQLVRQAGFTDLEVHPIIWERSSYGLIGPRLLDLGERSPIRELLPAQTIVTGTRTG
ncbi:MAG: methyltransferase domain-containing protein [Actinomycetes bacterium]